MPLQSRAKIKISDARRQIALLDAVAVAAGRNIGRATANTRMRSSPAIPAFPARVSASFSGKSGRINARPLPGSLWRPPQSRHSYGRGGRRRNRRRASLTGYLPLIANAIDFVLLESRQRPECGRRVQMSEMRTVADFSIEFDRRIYAIDQGR